MTKINNRFVSLLLVNSICGYSNPLSFKKIEDEDIDYIEKFVRENALNITCKELNIDSDAAALDNQLMMDVFGKACKHDPSNFCFRRGEKSFIKELVSNVKQIVDRNGINSGLKKFKFKFKTKISKRNFNRLITNIKSNDQLEASTLKFETNNNDNNCNINLHVGLKNDLLKRVETCLVQYSANSLVDIEMLEENTVNVQETDGKLYGNVLCIICQKQNKKNQRPKRVYRRI